MKPVADCVHSTGLTFDIHSGGGTFSGRDAANVDANGLVMVKVTPQF
jgi:hypothetical protein